jgi:hypothetical protein
MQELNEHRKQKKRLLHSKGVTYFDKKTERTVFFILTIIMLVWGIFAKLGF